MMNDEWKNTLALFSIHHSSFRIHHSQEGAPMELEQAEILCVRCARQSKTCCQSCEVYVTPGDVRRIVAHTGRHDFHEFKPSGDPIYTHHPDDPIWMPLVF